VVVDPGTVARDPRPAVESYLAGEADVLEVHHLDHLVVHLRR
jgi:hypothetical protein